MIVKVYSIASALPNGYKLSRLHSEIEVSGYVDNFGALKTSDGNLEVLGDSLINEAGLDSVIASHQLQTLAELKAARYLQIDGKTNYLISLGFSFDSKMFSLSLPAQMNWNTLKDSEFSFSWPVDISTLDNDTYTLTQMNLNAFWTAGKDRTKFHLDSGRALKTLIKNATTEAEVNAVADNR